MGRTTAQSAEVDRIVGLRVVPPLTSEELEEFSRQEIQARAFNGGFRFFEKQATAVLEYDMVGGLFGPIGVGWGKTLITLMVAARAFRAGLERSILFVPPEVYPQLVRRDIPWARQHVDLAVPFHLLGGRTQEERRALARSSKRGCYLFPYSCLSTKDSSDLLDWIDAGLLIMDEAHRLKNRTSARTKRVISFLEKREEAGRRVQVVALSGTISNKSIKDYHHLIVPALGDFAPVPLSGTLADQWALVLDAEADPSDAHLGPVTPLLEWARVKFPLEKLPPHVAGFRSAYRLRLTSAPGVVATGDADIGTSLLIQNRPIANYKDAKGWKELEEKVKGVEELWLSPSGDEIDYGFHQWRHLWELNSGFYYELKWPTSDQIRAKHPMSQEEADVFLDMAQAHHLAKQEYHRRLRKWLKEGHVAGLDTPMLVGKNMSEHGAARVGGELYEAWLAMKELEFPDMPERYSTPVRLCDFKIADAVKWAEELPKNEGILVWYHHDEIGEWLVERLRQADFREVRHCPAGRLHDAWLIDPKNHDKLVVLTLNAHGTGKNLQTFHHQRYAQFPRPADAAEQSLGRTHRNGQRADELAVSTANTTEFDHQNFAACLNDALYLHQTTGQRQKLIYAAYDPLPRIFPSDFLRERFQTRVLTKDQQKDLAERFGPR